MRRYFVHLLLTAAVLSVSACSSTGSAEKPDEGAGAPAQSAPAEQPAGEAPPAPTAEPSAAPADASVETVRDDKEAEKVIAEMDKESANRQPASSSDRRKAGGIPGGVGSWHRRLSGRRNHHSHDWAPSRRP